MIGLKLREWVRQFDDHEYVEIASAETPRNAVIDLYGPLAAARQQASVVAHSQVELLDMPEFRTITAFKENPIFAALGFDACSAALADGATFSSKIQDDTIGPVWGHSILGMDDPAHRRYRALINKAFTRPALARLEAEVVRPIVDGLIDRFADNGCADLVPQFCMLFPVYVITELLGLPVRDLPAFHGWAAETISVFYDFDRGIRAAKALVEYLDPIIDARRGDPGDDLVSALAVVTLDGERLDTSSIDAFVRLLLPAGGETTFRSTANLLFALLQHDAQRQEVARRRGEILAAAVEEGLRWEPPLSSISRVATADTVLDGLQVPKGAIVECALGVANRDPARWETSDRFDLHRRRQAHLAFAWGPHTCLGQHLARLETTAAVNVLLDRLPNLHLDPDVAPPVIRGIGFRSPDHLRVRF